MKKDLPTLSIVTVSYDSDLEIFKESLESIKKQNYPKNKIEHIVYDGGSKSGCVELARKYKCKVVIKKDLKNKAEERQYLALKRAKNDILVILETDNILPDANWFIRMVEPFQKNSKVFCTYSAFNTVRNSMPLLTRYCALFGVSDPVLYYLNKSDKEPLSNTAYTKGKLIKKYKNYMVVKFDKNSLPTLGDNGCLIKNSAFNALRLPQKDFIHLDMFVDFIEKNYNIFAVVNNGIIHITGSSIIKMIKRRLLYRKMFFEEIKYKRKYLVYNPELTQDKFRLFYFFLATVTFVIPIVESLKGYIKVRDSAWFLHIVMCWVFLIGYGYLEYQKLQRRIYEKVT